VRTPTPAPEPILGGCGRGEVDLNHLVGREGAHARRALAVAQVESLVDALSAEGVAAARDAHLLVVARAQRAFELGAHQADLLV